MVDVGRGNWVGESERRPSFGVAVGRGAGVQVGGTFGVRVGTSAAAIRVGRDPVCCPRIFCPHDVTPEVVKKSTSRRNRGIEDRFFIEKSFLLT
jgi:hypothetical protein